MKRTLLFVSVVTLAACESKPMESTEDDSTGRAAPELTKAAADNTEVNERDRNPSTLTPEDQGGSEADRMITQSIRQGVVGHDDLSVTAQNVKIITLHGVVTLRGPVKSEQERLAIAKLAQGVAGVTRVDNQLEIASQ